MKAAWQKRLKKAKKLWEEKKSEKPPGFFEFDPGIYVFRLLSGKITQAKSDGHLQVQLEWACLDAPDECEGVGETLNTFHNLEDPERFARFQDDLRKLGVDVDELELDELETVLDELTEEHPVVRFSVSLSQDKSRTWANMRKKLDADEFDADEEPETETKEEETEVEFEKDDRVSAEFEGETFEGLVLKVDKEAETCKIEFDNGDLESWKWEDLEKLDSDDEGSEEEAEESEEEAEESEYEPSKGDRVFVEIDDNTYEGTLTKVSQKKQMATVKFDDEDVEEIGFDDLTLIKGDDEDEDADEDEEEEEEAEIGKGSSVIAILKDGKEANGKVVSVDESKGTCKVKCGKKTHTVKFEDLELDEDED